MVRPNEQLGSLLMAIFKHAQSESNKTFETPQPNDLVSTGAALREGREAQRLSLHDLASQLNMGDEQLTALETGDRSNLPEAVFIRASVRRVANKLGLDPEPLIAQLRDLDQTSAQQTSQPIPDPNSLLNANRSMGSATAKKPLRLGWGWLRFASGLAAVSAVAVAGWRWSQTTNFQTQQPLQPSNEVAAKPVASPTASAQNKAPNTVTIITSQPSWIAIRNRGGALLFEGMVEREKTLTTSQPLEIYAGRPDLVQVLSGRDQQGPLGSIDQVRWYPINAAPSPTAATL